MRWRGAFKVVYAAGRHERLEPHDARVQQLAKLGRVVSVVGHQATPEGDVHVQLAACSGKLAREHVGSDGGGEAVQRHVNARGDATRSGGACRGGEAFPVCAPWLVHMHVHVHKARAEHRGPVVKCAGRRNSRGGHCRDAAALHAHGGGEDAVGRHHTP